tara:strand:+ start:128 stop:1354 length:1227 start_codon:yes stop_codon:yes gene_type:complete
MHRILKFFNFVKKEPHLAISFFLAPIIVFIIILLRPIIKLRVGFLRSDRLGHFAANTELYLCEKIANKKSRKEIDLFYFPSKLCNDHIGLMCKKKLIVLPKFFLRSTDLLLRSYKFFKPLRALEHRGGDRDIDHLFDRYVSNFQLTKEDEKKGQKILNDFGLPDNIKFVCVTVRDSAYLNWLYEEEGEHHESRNSDIDDYLDSLEDIANKGYYVFRMGKIVEKKIVSKNPKIIDYASSEIRSDFMDVYLGAKCEFCISTSTGFDAIPFIFRKPIVYLNMIPIGWLFTFRKEFIGICKHYFSIIDGRELNLQEIFDSGCAYSTSENFLLENGVSVTNNTKKEIKDTINEMLSYVSGEKNFNDVYSDDQKKFWSIYKKNIIKDKKFDLHGKFYSRYNSNFLNENKWFIEN